LGWRGERAVWKGTGKQDGRGRGGKGTGVQDRGDIWSQAGDGKVGKSLGVGRWQAVG
jgi:hypothetical protein